MKLINETDNYVQFTERRIKIMKKSSKNMLAIIISCVMACMSGMYVKAVSNEEISLKANQVWTEKRGVERSGQFMHVWAGLKTVYPITGKDNFEKIQTRVVNATGTNIMDGDVTSVILTEGTGDQKIILKEGFLNLKRVYFQFRGNSKEAAEAVVNYYSS